MANLTPRWRTDLQLLRTTSVLASSSRSLRRNIPPRTVRLYTHVHDRSLAIFPNCQLASEIKQGNVQERAGCHPNTCSVQALYDLLVPAQHNNRVQRRTSSASPGESCPLCQLPPSNPAQVVLLLSTTYLNALNPLYLLETIIR